MLELIGDIAGYRPGGKVVIFEGENSEFDVRMTGKLFPTYERKMNFVSGGNKRHGQETSSGIGSAGREERAKAEYSQL